MAAMDGLLLGGLVARWSYGCGLHGTLRVTSLELENTTLSEALVVAFASDFHAGPSTHPAVFKTLVDELKAVEPHVLLLGGDYVCC